MSLISFSVGSYSLTFLSLSTMSLPASSRTRILSLHRIDIRIRPYSVQHVSASSCSHNIYSRRRLEHRFMHHCTCSHPQLFRSDEYETSSSFPSLQSTRSRQLLSTRFFVPKYITRRSRTPHSTSKTHIVPSSLHVCVPSLDRLFSDR